MTLGKTAYIGFTCAYTPLALIDAAGYVPYRILPTGDSPDRAGELMHDNLCPHVKRVLDRALANDLPEMEGIVLINSCDAMRRLADAWKRARPGDRVVLVDLPVTSDKVAVSYFSRELSRLAETLFRWNRRPVAEQAVAESIKRYRRLATGFEGLRAHLRTGTTSGGAARLQSLYNSAVTRPIDEVVGTVEDLANEARTQRTVCGGVPVFAFGNVLPDPEALALFESCGTRIVDEDFCTGSRVFQPMEADGSENVLSQLAFGLLSRSRCARTIQPMRPGMLAQEVLVRATACGARGVIACTAKFCDPYIARMPGVREVLRKASLPLLQIEGDCTMRSLGQQRTRIEAFGEMLGRVP